MSLSCEVEQLAYPSPFQTKQEVNVKETTQCRVLELHYFIPGLHLAKNSIFVQAPGRERPWSRAPRQTEFQGSRAPKTPTLGP